MTLEVPEHVILADGTTAQVKGVAANVVAGQLEQVVFTVEKRGGAWTEVTGQDVRPATGTREHDRNHRENT